MVKKKKNVKKKKKKSTETSSFRTVPSVSLGPWALSLPIFCPAHSSQKAERKKQSRFSLCLPKQILNVHLENSS